MHELFTVTYPLVLLPGQDAERQDRLPGGDAFALSPLYYRHADPPPPAESAASSDASDARKLKRLRRLRRRPAFALLAESVLLLRSVQLDIDYPPPWPYFVREQLVNWLAEIAGQPLNPDLIHLQLHSPHLWVDEQDREHGQLQLSLTQLAIATGEMERLPALLRMTPDHDAPLPELPSWSASTLLRQLVERPWADHYQQQLERFWQNHADTWRQLARLSLLDELARQFKHKAVHLEGYRLLLDALGYQTFPDSPQAFAETRTPRSAEVWLLYLDEEVVPGLIQIRSPSTSHCFILRPGSGQPPLEYISDSPTHITERLLAALNDSQPHRQWLHDQPASTAQARRFSGDLFDAQRQACQAAAEQFWLPASATFMWQLIKVALNLAGAVDLWQPHPPLLDNLPAPLPLAAKLMKHWLHSQHRLELDPRQVFVAWRPGHKRTPLGHVRQAGSRIHSPSTRPINLARALVDRYQAEQPEGYLDEGGHWTIWHDPTGKGRWQADRVLAIDAAQLAGHIAAVDFSALMTRHLEDFWHQQQPAVEQALRGTLLRQALTSLKLGHLQRHGFDAVVEALSTNEPRWTVLGFQVQSAFIAGLQAQHCANLLLLAPAEKPLRVLYQAGLQPAFVEFANPDALNRYLLKRVGDEQWRIAVMRYIPDRHRERLDYLFRFWAAEAPPRPPASILRPWTDIVFHPDQHKTVSQSLFEQALPAGAPFAFMCQTLKANALEHARQTIVTAHQQTLRYWSEQVRHLQWLIAPLSLLPPGAIAALATELGLAALDIAQANLPGHRYPEKQQALFSLLSLRLWRLGPATPRLLSTLHKTAGQGRQLLRGSAVLRAAGAGWPGRVSSRQTRLVPFFNSTSLLKRWTVSGPQYGNLPVHAWKLGRKFLLWTSDRGQARTLVVSTHGYHLPWSRTVKIPNGTEIHSYAPHGHVLIDPGLHRVVSQRVGPFAISSSAGNLPALPPLTATDKLLAGTVLRGRLKNYTIAKYQGAGTESYADVSRLVRDSNSGLFSGQLPPTPMDVLTVRNRFGSLPATLDELFGNLFQKGIHYDRILLVHCRCAALQGLLDRAPVYTVPARLPVRPISP